MVGQKWSTSGYHCTEDQPGSLSLYGKSGTLVEANLPCPSRSPERLDSQWQSRQRGDLSLDTKEVEVGHILPGRRCPRARVPRSCQKGRGWSG